MAEICSKSEVKGNLKEALETGLAAVGQGSPVQFRKKHAKMFNVIKAQDSIIVGEPSAISQQAQKSQAARSDYDTDLDPILKAVREEILQKQLQITKITAR